MGVLVPGNHGILASKASGGLFCTQPLPPCRTPGTLGSTKLSATFVIDRSHPQVKFLCDEGSGVRAAGDQQSCKVQRRPLDSVPPSTLPALLVIPA